MGFLNEKAFQGPIDKMMNTGRLNIDTESNERENMMIDQLNINQIMKM